MPTVPDRILLHLRSRRRLVVDPDDIYFLEADGTDTLVRTRSKRRLRDVRPLGSLELALAAHPFIRIHSGYLVNGRRIAEIRRTRGADAWEVKLEPPVSTVLPVARRRVTDLWAAYEDEEDEEY